MRKIKKKLDPVIKAMVSNKLGWQVSKAFIQPAEWMKYQRSLYDRRLAENNLKNFFRDRVVRNGFFKGMKYASFQSAGSSLFPKLLGSYESELHTAFFQFRENPYEQILDIGCAEGYYVVGLALQFPGAMVYGYDIDPNALRLCSQLSQNNHTEACIVLQDACTASTLETFSYSGRSLIICDCEGYEQELFTGSNVGRLGSADLLIELHPFEVKDVKEYLTDLFSGTHSLNFISSHDNNRKIFDFNNSLQSLTPLEKLYAVEEGRPFTMEWLVATSKLYGKG